MITMRRGSPSPRGGAARGRSRTSPAPTERCTSCLVFALQLLTCWPGKKATMQELSYCGLLGLEQEDGAL
jgi:hypothetical protein